MAFPGTDESSWYLLKQDQEVKFPGAPTKTHTILGGTLVYSANKEKKGNAKKPVSVKTFDPPQESLSCRKEDLTKIDQSELEYLKDKPINERFNYYSKHQNADTSTKKCPSASDMNAHNHNMEIQKPDPKPCLQTATEEKHIQKSKPKRPQKDVENELRVCERVGCYVTEDQLIYGKVSHIETQDEEGSDMMVTVHLEPNPGNRLECKVPASQLIRDPGIKQSIVNTKDTRRSKKPERSTCKTGIEYKNTIRKNWKSVLQSPDVEELKRVAKKLISEGKMEEIGKARSELDETRLLLGNLLKGETDKLMKDKSLVVAMDRLLADCHPVRESDSKHDINFNTEFEMIKAFSYECKQRLHSYKYEICNAIDIARIVDTLFERNVLSCQHMMDTVLRPDDHSKFDLLLTAMSDMEDEKLSACLQCVKEYNPDVYKVITNVTDIDVSKEVRKDDKKISGRAKKGEKQYEAKLPPATKRKRQDDENYENEAPQFQHLSSPFKTLRLKRPTTLKESSIDLGSQHEPIMPEVPATSRFTIGSMVEVKMKYWKAPAPGVIRWIGVGSKPMAGLEMENVLPFGVPRSCTTVDGHIGLPPFQCSAGRRFFIPLDKCQPDSRFQSSHASLDNEFGLDETEAVLEDVPPIDTLGDIIGHKKGIQGHYNSCYLDASLFAMFAFNDSFDYLLEDTSQSNLTPLQEDIKLHMKQKIINPLRRYHQVRADNIMDLRRMLDKLGTVQGLLFNEKDPEEFLAAFVQHTLQQSAFMQLSHGDGCYIYTMTGEKDANMVPTTQKLVNASFLESQIKLKDIPENMIIQIPRSGKHFKMYDMVFPSHTLCINDIVDNVGKECLVCNGTATIECRRCGGDMMTKSGRVHAYFCDTCGKQRHTHQSRDDHEPEQLCQGRKKKGRKGAAVPQAEMELYAVLCIETSHYVCFVKSGKGQGQPWVMFDSMADRTGAEEGFNIPCVTLHKDISEWLTEEGYKKLLNKHVPVPKHIKRLFSDIYLCFYRNCVC